MKQFRLILALASLLLVGASTKQASGAPCLIVTLTGAKGGPTAAQGLACAGALVRYGDDSNGCAAVKLQFNAGRAASVRLFEIGVTAGDLDAIFFTYMHSYQRSFASTHVSPIAHSN